MVALVKIASTNAIAAMKTNRATKQTARAFQAVSLDMLETTAG